MTNDLFILFSKHHKLHSILLFLSKHLLISSIVGYNNKYNTFYYISYINDNVST